MGVVAAWLAFSFTTASARAQIEPERLYYAINRAVPVSVRVERALRPSGAPDVISPAAAPEIVLLEPETAKVLERASAAEGRVDLAAMFPLLWTTRKPRVLYAQLVVDGRPMGPGVVLQPMLSPHRSTDALAARLKRALDRQDRLDFSVLIELPASGRESLRQSASPLEEPEAPQYSGLRVYADRHVVLETTAGEIELALRPDKAPNTAFNFIHLVEGGFYTGVPFHRVVNADARGRPFIVQAGDPTGLGAGGPGYMIDFEAGDLAQGFGVVSMARQPTDPNSAGSQFFIGLSREACAPLDGQYVAFAQTLRGAETLAAIAASPVAPADAKSPPGGARSGPFDRPVDPPLIRSARTVPAPPYGTGPGPIEPKPVDR